MNSNERENTVSKIMSENKPQVSKETMTKKPTAKLPPGALEVRVLNKIRPPMSRVSSCGLLLLQIRAATHKSSLHTISKTKTFSVLCTSAVFSRDMHTLSVSSAWANCSAACQSNLHEIMQENYTPLGDSQWQ